MTSVEKLHIANAFKFELGKLEDSGVQQRVIDNILLHVDYSLASDVAQFLGAKVPESVPYPNKGASSKFLSQVESIYSTANPTCATRKVGVLLADGYDHTTLQSVQATMKAQNSLTLMIAPHKTNIKSSSGSEYINADFTYHTSRSIMFDALIVLTGNEQYSNTLKSMGIVGNFINEAYAHNKVIGAIGSGVDVVKSFATGWSGVVYATDNNTINSHGVITTLDYSSGIVKNAAAAVGVNTGSFDTEYVNTLKFHRVWDRDVSRVPA